MFRVQHIDHVELYVPDQYEAAKWYEQVLGLQIVAAFEEWAAGGPLMIATANNTTMLALFKGEPVGSRAVVGFRRVAFRVDSAGFLAFLDHIEQNVKVYNSQGERLSHRHVVDHDKSFSIYFNDPWGNPYEVTSYDYAQISLALK